MGSLLSEIHLHGVSATLAGDLIELCPLSKMPPDLLSRAKAHKPELMAELLADTPPPLTDRQLAQLNKWLDSTGETVEADRQLVIDECQTSKKKRAAYVETFKLWERIKSEVKR